MHVLITGASGSGTTTLGRALASEIGAQFVDADDIFWLATEPPYQQKRARGERLTLLRDRLSSGNRTVVSGSIQDLGAEVEDAFGLIVLLQVPVEVRVPRLRERELARFGKVDEEFIAWAAQYDEGKLDGRSLARQLAWLQDRLCRVVRLIGAYELPDSLAQVRAQLPNRSFHRTLDPSASPLPRSHGCVKRR